LTLAELTQAGVRRISVGGGFARVAWTAVVDAVREVQQHGTFSSLGRAIPGREINAMFD
jgi:methylisocitrate lyase